MRLFKTTPFLCAVLGLSLLGFLCLILTSGYYNHVDNKTTPNATYINAANDNTNINSKSIVTTTSPSNPAQLDSAQLIFFVFLLLLLLIIICIALIKILKAEEQVLIEKERFRCVFELTDGVIWEYNYKIDTLTKSDPDIGIHTGFTTTKNFINIYLKEGIIHPDDTDLFLKFSKDLQDGKNNIIYELRGKDLSGEYKWFELTARIIKDKKGKPILAVGQTTNIDSRKQAIESFKSSNELDHLTKITNRKTAKKIINNLLTTETTSQMHGILLLDIDSFETINKTYGTVFGDALLIELATKLTKYYEKSCNVVCRVGGDEFLLFLSNIPSIDYMEEEATSILNVLSDIIIRSDKLTNISGCIGMATYPTHGHDFDTLLKNADSALYYAKQQGPNHILMYDISYMHMKQYMSFTPKLDPDSSYPLSDRTIIDAGIIASTIEILFDAKEIEPSINMMLSLIGHYYNLLYINIIEYSGSTTFGHITYEWSSDNQITNDASYEINGDALSKLIDLMNKNDSIFYSNEKKELSFLKTDLFTYLDRYNLTGIANCAFAESGSLEGHIGYFYNKPNRIWKSHEINSLVLISKIISGYLVKLRTQQKAERIECTDPLTGSYNLITFTNMASTIIKNHPENQYIIMYSDIDKFKLINENYGYSEGDRILIVFANTLKELLYEEETFGRVNADKFIALMRYNNPYDFLRRIKILNKKMNSINKTDSDHYRLSIIMGLYLVTDYSNMSLNIDRANLARKSIIGRHKSKYAFFNESMKSNLLRQHEIEDLMEDALQNKEFEIYYQPKVYLDTNEICSAEALVRWNHPDKGLLPPSEFIPIFEENHFILKLDFYVFDHVCAHIRKLLNQEKRVYPISVNFSRVHLTTRDFITNLLAIIKKYQIPTNLLELELTETALSNDNSYMITILNKLHQLGFKLSMDDFGSGLSSLNLLRQLPFDILKLDKDFLQQGSATNRERIVIKNIVKMAKELHMDIVSEGVETEEQAQFLRSIECNMAQGYLFDRPMPEIEFEKKYYEA